MLAFSLLVSVRISLIESMRVGEGDELPACECAEEAE
jgi:hypothetical protein